MAETKTAIEHRLLENRPRTEARLFLYHARISLQQSPLSRAGEKHQSLVCISGFSKPVTHEILLAAIEAVRL